MNHLVPTNSQLLERLLQHQPHLDSELITSAYQFALKHHQSQTRYSGEPYIIHPIATAEFLASWQLDTLSVISGLLHDTIEDGQADPEQLELLFGAQTRLIVEGVTKISHIRLQQQHQFSLLENLRKMIIATSKDLRVILVKLADRLHNMQTLEYVPANKQKRIAQETLQIYAPIADRLSMGKVKSQLEDLAFPYVYPQEYAWVKQFSAKYYARANEHTLHAQKRIRQELAKHQLPATVQARTKHLYSLYRKLMRKEINRDISKIYDLVAIRVIVERIDQCYLALGLVHNLWKPAPQLGFKDYIAQPKPNGYQSLHTKVIMGNRIVEVQIRTHDMHHQAEYGLASHWYLDSLKNQNKIGSEAIEKGNIFTPSEKMHWVNQLVSMLNEIKDNQELMTELKLDMFKERIFVFTPQGDVIDLPLESTPVDFAYAIHSQLGDLATGAKVNGKLVSLDYKLHSGDICEIIKSRKPKLPSPKWLDFAITRSARSKIRKRLGLQKTS